MTALASEQDAGRRDAHFDAGQGHTGEAQHPAEGHHQRERHGKQPYGRRPELCAPEADRDHGQQVVEARERTVKTGEEALGAAPLDERPGDRRPERSREGEERAHPRLHPSLLTALRTSSTGTSPNV